jgi:dCMP deaminase
MKEKHINAHMAVAETYAGLSTATRLKVGAIVVKDDRIISIGYNGMPAGWDNNCEDKDYMSSDAGGWVDPDEIYKQWPFEETVVVANDNESFEIVRRYRLKTKPEVLHAERNALDKLARLGGVGSAGAAMFTTHAPCLECSKSIYGAGITEVFYGEDYRSEDGIYFLKKCGVNIVKISKSDK